MKGATLESRSLKLEIMPEGQELVREVIELASRRSVDETNITGEDLKTVIGDALMYYKILLEHKSKGGEVVLKLEDQHVNLPVVSSIH